MLALSISRRQLAMRDVFWCLRRDRPRLWVSLPDKDITLMLNILGLTMSCPHQIPILKFSLSTSECVWKEGSGWYSWLRWCHDGVGRLPFQSDLFPCDRDLDTDTPTERITHCHKPRNYQKLRERAWNRSFPLSTLGAWASSLRGEPTHV